MEACNQTNIPILNIQEGPCIQGSLLTDCIFYGLAIDYLGTQDNVSFSQTLGYIVTKLVTANLEITAIEEINRSQQLLIEQLQTSVAQNLIVLGNLQSQVEACCSTTTTTIAPTTTTSTTTAAPTTEDPLYYYVANQYSCPNCDDIVGQNVIIKGSTPVPIGNWVIRNPGSGWITYQVLSQTTPFYMAALVDTYGSTPTCICPGGTTSTTTTI